MAKHSEKKKPRQRTGGTKQRSGFKGWFKHHQQVAVDSLDRLLGETASSLLTWAVIGIALALPLCLLLLMQNLQQFGSDIDDASQIALYMELELSEDSLQAISNDISLHASVESVQLITSSQALADFQDASGFGDVLEGLDENPLPAVLLVNPATEDVAQVASLFAELEGLVGVDSAQLDMEWIQRLYSILNLAQRMTLVLAALLCVGVVLVVGNTVRLAIENRRPEIVVVKLVGGTDAYVARPFLYTGLWYGVGGGLIACLLVLLAQIMLQGSVSRMAGLYESNFSLLGLNISDILMVLLGSGLLGWVGAWLSVLRHLKSIEPR
jgi:cell division transport system permease protein